MKSGTQPAEVKGADVESAGGVRLLLVDGAGHHLQNDLQKEIGAVALLDLVDSIEISKPSGRVVRVIKGASVPPGSKASLAIAHWALGLHIAVFHLPRYLGLAVSCLQRNPQKSQ